jgi:hypothetical protein
MKNGLFLAASGGERIRGMWGYPEGYARHSGRELRLPAPQILIAVGVSGGLP